MKVLISTDIFLHEFGRQGGH